MTTYEHAMLGITGVLAAGLNRRYGWPIAAIAAVAAVSPDWDGVTIVAGAAAFAASHRVWGHNVWACILTGILIGCLDYRFDAITRCGRLLARLLHLSVPGGPPLIRDAWSLGGLAVWISVAVLAALSHLAADIIFVAGMFPMWKWPGRLQSISAVTLAAVVLYVAARGAWL
ncbi:MAG: metal-dependent hydrolase [Pirellulaceae bacterium]|nr:metal-dependent hydrolase [Pirellulaceae bacterium]